MLDKISINFLIALAMMNGSWMAYGIKIHSSDITIINTICTIASYFYVIAYIRIKFLLEVPWKSIIMLTGAVIFQILMMSDDLINAN